MVVWESGKNSLRKWHISWDLQGKSSICQHIERQEEFEEVWKVQNSYHDEWWGRSERYVVMKTQCDMASKNVNWFKHFGKCFGNMK